jgi:hypothetical protein
MGEILAQSVPSRLYGVEIGGGTEPPTGSRDDLKIKSMYHVERNVRPFILSLTNSSQ